MTDTFTASNGIEVTMDPDREGKVYLVGRRARGDEGQYLDTHATGGPEGIVALREFFQHERDETRGLWRSAADPTWTAVRRNTCIYFQNEDHERSFHFVPKLEASIKSWSSDLQALAYEYIEAHPERKPWEDATYKDVWVWTTTDDTEEALGWVAGDGTWDIITPKGDGIKAAENPMAALVDAGFEKFSGTVTGVRRTPEDAS
ncbi:MULTISPECIES: hypothetical protein [unclassified Microbacterium]|uniref:hypothetical protein n=1 Tax=unclassified Microbacterium TaxID=2609290 RepID=UPI0014859335|nr:MULTISPECIES: hypothetical protein [unclassified Microbacterium]